MASEHLIRKRGKERKIMGKASSTKKVRFLEKDSFNKLGVVEQILLSDRLENYIKKTIKECVVIDGTNVSDYFYKDNDKTFFEAIEEVPNFAPPFDNFLVFYPCKPLDHGMMANVFLSFPSEVFPEIIMKGGSIPCDPSYLHENGVKWLVICCVLANPTNIWINTGYKFNFFVKADGSLLQKDGHSYVPIGYEESISEIIQKNDQPMQDFCSIAAYMLSPAVLTVGFMHCKNVKIREAYNKPVINRKHRDALGNEKVKYHILDINPIKEILRTEGQSEKTGLKKALHICRGHFSTYTEERKLFGKHAGTFWIPQHARGGKDHGVIDKSYNITL